MLGKDLAKKFPYSAVPLVCQQADSQPPEIEFLQAWVFPLLLSCWQHHEGSPFSRVAAILVTRSWQGKPFQPLQQH